WGYTRLTGTGALIVIGSMMTLSVPLRRLSRRRGLTLSDGGLGIASFFWGVLVGGTSGAGIILLSMLMAVGLQRAAVIATDAAISVLIGVVKIAVFGAFGAVTAKVVAVALLIGVVAFPGAFLAKAIVDRLPLHVHTAILDAVVIAGGLLMITGALVRSYPLPACGERSTREARRVRGRSNFARRPSPGPQLALLATLSPLRGGRGKKDHAHFATGGR